MITIQAVLLEETDKAWRLDCEGDIEWFPKSQCEFDEEDEALSLPEWLFKQKFPDEEI